MTDSTPQPASPSRTPGPQIHTYHCLCSHLLLASTRPLSALPRRSASSLDKAYILPLPPPPRAPSAESDSEAEDNVTTTAPTIPSASRQKQKRGASTHYALLLSTSLDKKPLVVRRSDGFEKRWVQRCGRCRVGIGYQLDWAQFGGASGEVGGRRGDVVYLLPGGLVGTEEMVEGRAAERGEWEIV